MAAVNVGNKSSKTSFKGVEYAPDKMSAEESFTLPLLQVIRDAQQQHGLRHGDYQRYRQYCARRLHRVRTALHFPMGSKHKVQPRKLTIDTLSDLRLLYIPLIDAERCWAYAMQLKVEANTERRKKFHMLRKLRKAVVHAEALAALCQHDKCDARTKLEAEAYYAWMKGTLFFEVEEWKQAIEQFNAAKTIYEKLAGAVVDDSREVYQLKCDEIVPSIRYCSYNIGDKSAINDLMQMRGKAGAEDAMTSKLDELIEKTRMRQAAVMSEVTWRGRTVPVKSEHARLLLLNIQSYEQQLANTDTVDGQLSIYEKMAKDLVDVQQLLKDEYKDDPNFKAGLRGGEERVSNGVYLFSYVSYLRLVKTAERNLVMVEALRTGRDTSDRKKSMKPQDYARLYDIVVQNLTEVQQLPLLADDDTVMAETRTFITFCKTLRCYYLAQGYVSVKRWREAIALLDRVQQYGQKTVEGLAANTPLNTVSQVIGAIVKNRAALEQLLNEADGQKYMCLASSIVDLDLGASDTLPKTTVKSLKPLIERLDEYVEDPSIVTGKTPVSLVQLPPDFEPVPCKPLFFDIALGMVQFPNLDDRIEKKKEGGAPGGGISGFVKGWLWGGSKK